jgi:hypothetical protein
MTIGTLLAIIGAAMAIALACRWAAGCYRRRMDEVHAHLQALCEFHQADDTKP